MGRNLRKFREKNGKQWEREAKREKEGRDDEPLFFFVFFFFLGPRQRPLKVPRLGVKSERQLPAYTTTTATAASAAYTRSLIH